jgi:putative redox protein
MDPRENLSRATWLSVWVDDGVEQALESKGGIEMAVEIDIEYQGDLHCKAIHGPSGDAFITDAPVDNGGKGEAFSPTDLMAAAFGTCIVTIMGIMANRNNIDIRGAKVHVEKEMAASPARRIASLKAKVTFPAGLALSASDRVKLEQSAKSCPVKQSLHPDVITEVDFIYGD